MSTRSKDWDATTYDRVSGDAQFLWAMEQLDKRLPLRGDEIVLDAGCGSGRVTAELVKRVPRGRVYGVDQAPSMVEHARQKLGDTATILEQELTRLEPPEPVDVIFSNATFHWIKDHDALFAALARALKPGGRLVAQCGGQGNIDRLRRVSDEVALREEPFAAHFAHWVGPWNYAAPQETTERLEHAGFTDVECWLEPKPVTPSDPHTFVKTVCLVRHLDYLPEALKDDFIATVLENLAPARAPLGILPRRIGARWRRPAPVVIEYVRLNLTGRRASVQSAG
jgi:trans-aconitate 2-methyltransferase